jgi:hypothetical protein
MVQTDTQPCHSENDVHAPKASRTGADPALILNMSLPCPGCGYDVRGLTGSRCPECGITFSRTDILNRFNESFPAFRTAYLESLFLPVRFWRKHARRWNRNGAMLFAYVCGAVAAVIYATVAMFSTLGISSPGLQYALATGCLAFTLASLIAWALTYLSAVLLDVIAGIFGCHDAGAGWRLACAFAVWMPLWALLSIPGAILNVSPAVLSTGILLSGLLVIALGPMIYILIALFFMTRKTTSPAARMDDA